MASERGPRVLYLVSTLPDDLLLGILSLCSFRDLLQAQLVCKRLNTLLSQPQASAACKPWGDMDFRSSSSPLTKHIVRLCSAKPEDLAERMSQVQWLEELLPTCRWLASRAPGMRSLSLKLSDPREFPDDWDGEGLEHMQWACRAFLPALIGALRGRAVDIKLFIDFPGSPDVTLCPPSFVRKLSQYVTELQLGDYDEEANDAFDVEEWSAKAIESLGSLDRLQALRTVGLDHMAALAPSLTQLPALRELELHNRARDLIVPGEITCLQSLSKVLLHYSADCSALLHLPALQSLDLYHVREPLMFPSELSCLTRLTKLSLHSLTLAGDVCKLSRVCSLKAVSILCVSLADDGVRASLNQALYCLTELEELKVGDTCHGIQLTDLAACSKLTSLEVVYARLQDAVCSPNWQRLKTLVLSGNCLSSLPSGLNALPMLETLSLVDQASDDGSDLQLDGLTDCFDMPKLKSVDLWQFAGKRWSAESLYCIAAAMLHRSAEGQRIFNFSYNE